MIGLPFNDYQCLGSITEVVAELVRNDDTAVRELARKHATTEGLIQYIRGLPQKNDDGEKDDGPKIEACDPVQRLRVPADDPNCVERAAMYLAVAEMIDPRPARQLATLETPVGLHTIPVENGVPVILDPRLPRNCMDAAFAPVTPATEAPRNCPMPIETRDAIEWTAQLAEAGSENMRNGPSRVRRARNAMIRLVEEGAAPADAVEVDLIGWMLAIAERVAKRYGKQALAVVRSTAQAISDLADEALARSQRNLALEIAGKKLKPSPWLTSFATAAGRVGVDIGSVVLRSKLDSLGIGNDVVDVVEEELNREGLTLGQVAKPKRMPTIAKFAKRIA